jgi:ATP-dependent Clp protease ATP-binding subunit ClpC
MPSTFTIKKCPACQGFGVTNTKSGLLTCQICQGEALWLVDETGFKYTYAFPHSVNSYSELNLHQIRWVKIGLSSLVFVTTLVSSGILVVNNIANLSSILWHSGPINAIFGLSGLLSIVAFSYLHSQQNSTIFLDELETQVSALKKRGIQQIQLNDFANPRIEQLIQHTFVHAHQHHDEQINEQILLLSLVEQSRIKIMLARMEIPPIDFMNDIIQITQEGKSGDIQIAYFLPDARQRIFEGIEEALKQNFSYVDLEDIFLTFLTRPGKAEPVFAKYNLTYECFYAISRWYAQDQEESRKWAFWLEKGRRRPKGYMNRAWTALPTPFLNQFSVDITQLAASGRVATVQVRENEVKQILEILGRSTKNSVLLIGEPGVGKNTILEYIALKMIEEDVPEILKDKRLMALDATMLMSDQAHDSENMQQLIDEVAQAGNVILLINNLEVLANKEGSKSLDALTVLTRSLENNTIQILSSTTYGDFHRFIESNTALKNTLESVEIKEVNQDQALIILEEEAPQIEAKQKIFFTYPALLASIKLSKRYLPEQALPESAIKVLDEAASQVASQKQRWVTQENVETIVSRISKVPVQVSEGEEADKLLNMEALLHERIIGQDEAIKAVSESLRRARTGMGNPNKPIASFMFVGPTGVGKTETAKAIADIYFSQTSPMIRLDMSEYQDARAIYKLIGPPASETDSYTEGGTLTRPIRENPFSLILLDEIEKAFPSVLNLFLQIIDDGRVTENTGRTVFFNNAIIVATSNAGSKEIIELLKKGTTPEDLNKQIINTLTNYFTPEFINRFTAVIPYHSLTKDEILQVTRLILTEVINKVKQQGIEISFTQDAINLLGTQGFDPLFGARPLRHLIEEKVESLIAKKILDQSLTKGGSLRISAEMLE